MGVLWLGEVVTWEIAVGTVGIFAGILLLTRRPGGSAGDWPLWALALPIGAAFLRSLGHVLSKVGLDQVAEPFIAGMVGFVVSALITHAIRLARREARKSSINTAPIGSSRRGVFRDGDFHLNNAFMEGQVVTVIPIIAASPIFTLLMSWLIFRRERLTLKIVAAVFLVVPSVAFIAVS